VQVLERKLNARAGSHPSIGARLGEAIGDLAATLR
jgi:hypothetical protein